MPTNAQRDRARDLYLQRTYGITLAQYEELLALQGGVCAICKSPPKKQALGVDHDHKSGYVRGLLCFRCNHKLLPPSGEDPARLDRAAAYLRNPPAEQVVGKVIAPAKPRRRRRKKSTRKEE